MRSGRSRMGLLRPIAVGVVAMLVALPWLGGSWSWAQGAATARLQPSALEVAVGETATVSVLVENVTDLYCAEFQITFDPTLVEVVDADPDKEGVQIQPGDFLSPDWPLDNTVDNDNGTIAYALCQMNPRPSQSGDGVLATITWRSEDVGTSPLRLAHMLLAASGGVEIPASTEDGQVVVVSGEPAPTNTPTPTAAPTATATTPTPLPPTPTPTSIPIPATAAPTSTPPPSTPTPISTPTPPTATPTSTPPPTAIPTSTSIQPTPTPPATAALEATEAPTATSTSAPPSTATPTGMPAPTSTPVPTATPVPKATETPLPTATAVQSTSTAVSTATAHPVSTPTKTLTPIPNSSSGSSGISARGLMYIALGCLLPAALGLWLLSKRKN